MFHIQNLLDLKRVVIENIAAARAAIDGRVKQVDPASDESDHSRHLVHDHRTLEAHAADGAAHTPAQGTGDHESIEHTATDSGDDDDVDDIDNDDDAAHDDVGGADEDVDGECSGGDNGGSDPLFRYLFWLRTWALVLLLWFTGLRLDSLRALQWKGMIKCMYSRHCLTRL